MNTVTATKPKGQQILEVIETQLSGYPSSLIGKLTTLVMVRQNITAEMTDEQVKKVLDQRAEDVSSVVDRRIGQMKNPDPMARKDEMTPYEKGALEGIKILRNI